VEELNRHPEADLLYSDEDKVDHLGRRYEPHFKPDWNPDLFYSLNFAMHLAVYRRSVVEAMGGFREGVEGSQDYDLTLRVIEHIPAAAIRHIPQLLYHWRAVPGSVAMAPREKEYAHEAARQAIRAHLLRRGVVAEVRPAPDDPTWHRVVYGLPSPAPLVSLILPVTGRAELLPRVVAALLTGTDYAPLELLVASAGLGDLTPLLEGFREDPRVRVVGVRTAAPAAAAAEAIADARGEVVGLLGFVEPITRRWLAEMVSHALRPEIGAVGAKLYDQAGVIAHAGIVLGVDGVAGRLYRGVPRSQASRTPLLLAIRNCSAVTGACLVARRDVLEQVGGLDAANFPNVYFDVDLCLRLSEHGYRTVWTPYAELRWLNCDLPRPSQDETAGVGTLAQEERFLLSRWGDMLHRDPYFNPNLSLDWQDGGLAVPPRYLVPWTSAGPVREGSRGFGRSGAADRPDD
jgi:O-antigen biosynthesis protein